MLIDLAGVVRKPERKDLEVCKVKYVTEVTLNYTAPELKTSLENNEEEVKVDLCKCMSFSLGKILKATVLKFLKDEVLKKDLKNLYKSLTKKNPLERISVEDGMTILKKTLDQNSQKKADFQPFMKSLLIELENNFEQFGINPKIGIIEKNFINLPCSNVNPEKYSNLELRDLQKDLDYFILDSKERDKEKTLVLLGPSGSGKSTILQKKYLDVVRNWKPNDPIPFHLNLATETNLHSRWNWLNGILKSNLSFNLFSGHYSYPMVLFVDSFDETVNKNNYVKIFFKDLGNNKDNKIIICCRSEFIQKDQDLLEWFGNENGIDNDLNLTYIPKYIVSLAINNYDFEDYLEKYYTTE